MMDAHHDQDPTTEDDLPPVDAQPTVEEAEEAGGAAEAHAQRLEEKIDRSREDLVDTIDALAERVDPREVASRNAMQANRAARRTSARARAAAEDHPEKVGVAVLLLVLLLVRRWRRRGADEHATGSDA